MPDQLVVYDNQNPFLPPRMADGPLVRVYLDESSTGDRFRGYGGLWVEATAERALRARIDELRTKHGMKPHGEVKWVKATSLMYQPLYRAMVDLFCESTGVRFNALVVDRYNAGPVRDTSEDDHYHEMHWLLRKRLVGNHRYSIHLDHRTNRRGDRLSTLLEVLNAAARRDLGYSGTVRSVTAHDSRDEPLIQLGDLILGAVCYHFNGKHLAVGASAGKCGLSQHIAQCSGFLGGRIVGTLPSANKFNCWEWRPTMGRRE